jgi:hypothetical protein
MQTVNHRRFNGLKHVDEYFDHTRFSGAAADSPGSLTIKICPGSNLWFLDADTARPTASTHPALIWESPAGLA